MGNHVDVADLRVVARGGELFILPARVLEKSDSGEFSISQLRAYSDVVISPSGRVTKSRHTRVCGSLCQHGSP